MNLECVDSPIAMLSDSKTYIGMQITIPFACQILLAISRIVLFYRKM